MYRAVIVSMLGLTGCATGTSGACMNAYEALCETCPKSDDQDLVCKCLAETELAADDFSDIQKIYWRVETNDDAQRACDLMIIDVDYVTDAEKTECRETVATLDAYGADVCEDLGWQD